MMTNNYFADKADNELIGIPSKVWKKNNNNNK